jgi:hypothetical protein
MARMSAALTALAASLLVPLAAATAATAASGIAGRWDVTVRTPDGERPAWIDIDDTPGGFTARAVGFYGAPEPADIQYGDGRLVLGPTGGGLPPLSGRFNGRWIEGTTPQGWRWTAVRQPRADAMPRPWRATVEMFDGHDLDGWRTRTPVSGPAWVVEHGVLRGLGRTDLVSRRTFRDFRLHVECRLPEGGDAGIHLRGRYEVQLKCDARSEPPAGGHASIYGFVEAGPGGPPDADGWDALDITLVGRSVTVVLNGRAVIMGATIPGITGDALDSREGEPGPIVLQGYLGPVEFRRIDITLMR